MWQKTFKNSNNRYIKRKEILTRYNLNEPWEHSAKWNKPITKRQVQYNSYKHLYQVLRLVKIIETERRMMVSRAEGRWTGELIGTELQIYKSCGGGTSLVVQWLGLRAATGGGTSNRGQGTKIPHTAQNSQKEGEKWGENKSCGDRWYNGCRAI